jgi:DNA-3-methyladenine glycosylase II
VDTFVGDASIERVKRQVRRIRSLDHDGRGIVAVAERDPVIERLGKRQRYLRSVLFNSPYETAAWAIIGNRIRMQQAARIKAQMAYQLGETMMIDGIPVTAFPAPCVLAELSAFPGLSERKVVWLRGAGEADRLPGHETRFTRAVESAYDLDDTPSPVQVNDMAHAWKPYRTWVAVLLRSVYDVGAAR